MHDRAHTCTHAYSPSTTAEISLRWLSILFRYGARTTSVRLYPTARRLRGYRTRIRCEGAYFYYFQPRSLTTRRTFPEQVYNWNNKRKICVDARTYVRTQKCTSIRKHAPCITLTVLHVYTPMCVIFRYTRSFMYDNVCERCQQPVCERYQYQQWYESSTICNIYARV